MIFFIYIYISWLFVHHYLDTTFSYLSWVRYGDELFLLIELAYLFSKINVIRYLKFCKKYLIGLFIVLLVSFLINFSSPYNFLLFLISYGKPVVFGLFLFVLFRQKKQNIGVIIFFFIVWCLIQIPFMIVQMLSMGGDINNVDDVVGTFGASGSMGPGFLAGMIACIVFPKVVNEKKKLNYVVIFMTCVLVVLITGSKQVVLLIIASVFFYLCFFQRVNIKVFLSIFLVAIFIYSGFSFLINSEMYLQDFSNSFWMIVDFSSSRKIEGILLTLGIFNAHPIYYIIGTGPGMFTSQVALYTETYYAKIVNYAYFLQKPGGIEEGLGGTFSQSSSSFLSLVGEVGILGYLLFMALIWAPFFSLRKINPRSDFVYQAFITSCFMTMTMFLQNILDGGIPIMFFWAYNAYMIATVLSEHETWNVEKI